MFEAVFLINHLFDDTWFFMFLLIGELGTPFVQPTVLICHQFEFQDVVVGFHRGHGCVWGQGMTPPSSPLLPLDLDAVFSRCGHEGFFYTHDPLLRLQF